MGRIALTEPEYLVGRDFANMNDRTCLVAWSVRLHFFPIDLKCSDIPKTQDSWGVYFAATEGLMNEKPSVFVVSLKPVDMKVHN